MLLNEMTTTLTFFTLYVYDLYFISVIYKINLINKRMAKNKLNSNYVPKKNCISYVFQKSEQNQ